MTPWQFWTFVFDTSHFGTLFLTRRILELHRWHSRFLQMFCHTVWFRDIAFDTHVSWELAPDTRHPWHDVWRQYDFEDRKLPSLFINFHYLTRPRLEVCLWHVIKWKQPFPLFVDYHTQFILTHNVKCRTIGSRCSRRHISQARDKRIHQNRTQVLEILASTFLLMSSMLISTRCRSMIGVRIPLLYREDCGLGGGHRNELKQWRANVRLRRVLSLASPGSAVIRASLLCDSWRHGLSTSLQMLQSLH